MRLEDKVGHLKIGKVTAMNHSKCSPGRFQPMGKILVRKLCRAEQIYLVPHRINKIEMFLRARMALCRVLELLS